MDDDVRLLHKRNLRKGHRDQETLMPREQGAPHICPYSLFFFTDQRHLDCNHSVEFSIYYAGDKDERDTYSLRRSEKFNDKSTSYCTYVFNLIKHT